MLLAGLALLGAVARWFEQRSEVVDPALAKTHFTTNGVPTRLADVARGVDHVASELRQTAWYMPGGLR